LSPCVKRDDVDILARGGARQRATSRSGRGIENLDAEGAGEDARESRPFDFVSCEL
jgi:hypothetical protein